MDDRFLEMKNYLKRGINIWCERKAIESQVRGTVLEDSINRAPTTMIVLTDDLMDTR